ncbi:hypothetical protein F7725_024964 [Dissostichus mawsoni]|uniref:Ig-like domain-containing protein n=1 Tax=Dissostichus mawsoni TaxID=36200 RepID=A0A7J5X9R8_DISMA|nr:hypothetical protein F7725_024964 [Dissostichus mawsoni]
MEDATSDCVVICLPSSPPIPFPPIFTNPEVSSELIHIPSLVHHGIEGKSVLLSVETRYPLDDVEIQGTWSHTRPSGTRTTLVTFTKEATIINMMYRNHLLFKEPNVSLLIRKLNHEDEGDYHLNLNIQFHNQTGLVIKEERTVHVTVDGDPCVQSRHSESPSYAVVEDKANATLTCSVERGTRVVFQWLRDNQALGASNRYHFTQDNSTLFISTVRKEDKGTYHCVASNAVSQGLHSRAVDLNVYYGPYNLEVNSDQGLRTGEVFTINPESWSSLNARLTPTHPTATFGSLRAATPPRSSMRARGWRVPCRAFNNVTQKQDETQFTLVVAKYLAGKEKHIQEGSAFSPFAAVVVSSLFIIGCMLLFFLKRTCSPKRGHEDATEDFGIYEFVSVPGKMESAQASCRSLARLESIQDMHTTIYDVIRHVPETPSHSLLE